MRLFKDNTNKQIFLSVVLFFAVMAIYIEINILFSKFNINDIDITDSRVYSITEESIDKISRIDKNVEIKLVDFDDYLKYTTINDAVNLIKQYSNINNNIKISTSNSMDIQEQKYPYIVICYDENEKKISIDDLFLYKYSTDTCSDEEYYISEEVITNQLMSILNNQPKKVYFYLEKSVYTEVYFSTIVKRIQNLGNEVDYLKLSEDNSIPEDCKCIIIPPITEDISEEEKNTIEGYIENGGNIMFLEESKSLLGAETPNIEHIMNLYGFSVSDGVVIKGDDIVNNDIGTIYAALNTEGNVLKSLNNKSKMMLKDSGIVNLQNDEELKKLGIQYEIIASAGENTYLRRDMEQTSKKIVDGDEPVQGSIIGLSVNRKFGENESKAIVYASSLFSTDQPIGIQDKVTNKNVGVELVYTDDNEEVLANSIKYLTENEDTIILRKKHYNTIPSISILKDGITLKLMFVLPMIVLFTGYIVWRRRKNR